MHQPDSGELMIDGRHTVVNGPQGHLTQHAVDLRHHVNTIDQDGAIRAVAERDVQHSAVFAGVDAFATKHLFAPCLDILLLRQSA